MKPKQMEILSSHKKGFTLVELVVAFVILVVGVAAVLELVSQSALNARYAKDKTTATVLAQQKMEELLAQPDLTSVETEGDFGDAYPQFRWRAQISEVSGELSDLGVNLFRIVVAVEWRDRGQVRSVQLETLKSSVPIVQPQVATSQQQTGNMAGLAGMEGLATQGGMGR
ncbi:MAG: prepilin-type N-terminal cleavage/methylation domain-containing protein [Armatimonadetes bacterium]|nr:prepilin-type N-terminal cleavage/methylation domain-containing protein [Armatimonadota bacterium]MDW8027603.1 prepilin-type N-terminal cleavage/methylation domain-containing protein [Armatimonadota bacterium]